MARTAVDVADLEPLASPALAAAFPGLATALDPIAMRDLLADALGARVRITDCSAGQACYLGASCVVRYEAVLGDRRMVVTGRLFDDASSCSAYVAERLAPLADRARASTTSVVAQAVAEVTDLRLALSVFPIDGELPALVSATDVGAMKPALDRALSNQHNQPFAVEQCHVEAAHIGRQHRCVLRYRISAHGRSGRRRQAVIYGKLSDDDSVARSVTAVDALRRRISDVVRVPMPIGCVSSLRLALFEELPGRPCIAQLLRAALTGEPSSLQAVPTLGEAIDAAARAAAALHACDVWTPRRRPLAADVAAIRRITALIHPMTPTLADELDDLLLATEERATESAPQDPAYCHGDFSYTQLLFHGNRTSLIDFDTTCEAEPALDLGHFLAYLDLAARKSGRTTALVDEIARRFLTRYAQARGATPNDDLVERAEIYRVLSLIRLAGHAWQKLKPRRLSLVLDALDART